MAVPLNHKKHRSSLEINSRWRPTSETSVYMLSPDGKRLLHVRPGYEGELLVPDGVEEICRGALTHAKITVIYVPDTLKRCLSAPATGFKYIGYKAKRMEHDVLGTTYELIPNQFVLCEKKSFLEEKKKEFNKKRVPKAIRTYLLQQDDITWIFQRGREFADRFGALYSNWGGLCLESLPIGIKKYHIPNGVEQIAYHALQESTIEEIVVPESVKDAIEAFYGPSLTTVTLLGSNSDLSNDEFDRDFVLGKDISVVYIPRGSKSYYSQFFKEYSNKLIEM